MQEQSRGLLDTLNLIGGTPAWKREHLNRLRAWCRVFGDAFDFTGADFVEWCREAGFSRFEIVPLAGPSSAAIAYK